MDNTDDLAKLIESDISAAESYIESEVQEQRDQAYLYYYGEPYEGDDKLINRSKYKSREVFDSVESAKALMLETFASARRVVRFEATDDDDLLPAKAGNRVVNDVFYSKNRGYKLLEDAIHDALLAKLCVGKVSWHEAEEREPVEFEGISETDYQALQAQPDIEIDEVQAEAVLQQDEFGYPVEAMVYSGTASRTVDASYTKTEVIAPEKFICDPDASEIGRAGFAGDWEIVTASELVEMGFDPDLVAALKSDEDDDQWSTQGRHTNDDTFNDLEGDDANTPDDRRTYKLYEVYKYLDLNDDGVSELYQFYYVGRQVLDYEEVDSMPYRIWSPFPLSHRWLGMSLADVLLDVQKSTSVMTRNIIDQQMFALLGRYAVDLGRFANPRDLVEPKPGQVIDVDSPADAIWPFPTPDVSPSVFSTLEIFRQDQEARSGVSRLSQGLDSRALTGNNAASMIEDMTNASNRRAMRMAKSFAENWLKPLMLDIYNVERKNNAQAFPLEINGERMQVSPKQLPPRTDMTVHVALTPDEAMTRAKGLMTVSQVLTMDPGASGIYQDSERHAVYSDVFELMGYQEGGQYLRSPGSPDYVSPQMQQMQTQMQQMQEMMGQMQQALGDKERDYQLKEAAEQTKRMKAAADVQNKDEALDLEAQHKGDTQALSEREFQHRKRMDVAELQLERQGRDVSI